MKAGKLRHRVLVQKQSREVDDFGHRKDMLIDVAWVWADIRPLGSSERLAAFQMQSGQSHVVTIRWQPQFEDMQGDWRLKYQQRLFKIVGIPRNPGMRNEILVIDTKENPLPN